MKLSVAIATFNEEKNLPACLNSVRGLADEIVIVDGGSTDKTVAIAKKYGAKVIITDNPPIFHINKQKAIDACTGEWILQLDADERVTLKLKEEIKSEIPALRAGRRNPKSEINGFWLPRRNYFLGRFLTKGGQYPDYTLRLYRRGKGHLPCKSVHEQATVEGKVGWLKNDLLHHPFPDFWEYLNKANRYASLLFSEYKKQNLSTDVFSFIKYVFIVPKLTFLNLYIRHRGFEDGFAGFVFAMFSAVQKIIAYVSYWEAKHAKKVH